MGESMFLVPESVQEANEVIARIRAQRITSQDRHKSYANPKRKDIEFSIGEYIFLRVSPMKGVRRFGKKGKLIPKFVGLFEILERIGQVAYRLSLPPTLSRVHNVFHEKSVQILDKKDKVLRNKKIPLVKILWKNTAVEEVT
ncbi:uncharacterized protein LOC133815093 [Humulus lupulus]|uniref:uncharacterized protein LOC133815093 n=1 Tax=Humulus lupulus TaxID=3486 RepID=UPI002B412068|nr:uncharacterized protein LOC133815093 [Humulus lupulus]